ncbi:MAG: glycosyltransferase family 4 protein [Acidobacteriota bacterium]
MNRTALFWAYDPDVASFRHRLRPLAEALAARGWHTSIDTLPRGRYLRRIAARRRALAAADVLVLAKLKLGVGEHPLLRHLAPPIVYDVDDAVYLRQPRRLGDPPQNRWLRRWKFRATCRIAARVLAGNDTLAREARAAGLGPERIVDAPTPVAVPPFPESAAAARRGTTLVWIGRPENLPYLELARPAILALRARHPALRLRVVCSAAPEGFGDAVEFVRWSPEAEYNALATADVGLMPLVDDGWARGKCAFKLLQYMAAGLPCVASPVGASRQAVIDGETGFWAHGDDAWRDALGRLLDDPALRARQGRAGHAHAAAHYARRVQVPRVADAIERLVDDRG